MLGALAALAALPLAPLSSARADSEFDVSADLRTRYEADDRTFTDDTPLEHTLFARTRVRLDAKHGDGAEAVVEVQDSRVWGGEGSESADTHNVDLHQGFLRFQPWSVGTVDVGRQELTYGRAHVFGDEPFDNVGRSFDALKLHNEFSESWLDLLFGKVSEEAVTGTDENFAGGFVHLDVSEAELALEPFLLYKENSDGNEFLTAVGTYAGWGKERFSAEGDVVYETGQVERVDLRAYLLALDVAADFSPDMDNTRGLSIGVEKYTGDGDATDDKIKTYDPLYGNRHEYYGIMDVADSFVDGLGVGLRDFHAKFWTELASGVTCTLGGHVFRADVDTDLGAGADGKDVGREADLVVKGRLSDGVVLEAGGGIFLSGDLIEAVVDNENAAWGYLQATGSF
jgi:hypothetical protein